MSESVLRPEPSNAPTGAAAVGRQWSGFFARLTPVVNSLVVVVLAFVVAAVIYVLSGFDIAEVLSGTIRGAFTAPGALESTIRWSIPLIFLGLGTLIGFRAGFFNVGAQGQMYVGSVAALVVALSAPGAPPVVVVPLAILLAVAAGALWSLIAGFLRVRYGTDEVLTTLMLTFIGTLFLQWAVVGPLRDPAGTGQVAASRVIDADLRLSGSSGVSPVMLVMAGLVVIGVWLIVNRTGFGLQASLAGRNPEMARWQGVSIRRVGLTAFALGGGLAGAAGAIDLLGPAGRLNAGYSPTLGFTAVLVALVGTLSVPGAVLAAFFFGALQSAVLFLPIVTDLPRSALELLQGIVAMLITTQLARMVIARRAARQRAGSIGDRSTAAPVGR